MKKTLACSAPALASYLVLLGCSDLGLFGSDGSDGSGGAKPAVVTDYDGDPDHPTPFEGTSSGLVFSATRGVYSEPFDLTVTHPSAGEILYTLDCSDPRTSATALVATSPLTLHVDPADTTHRFLAPGFVVRATANGTAALPEQVATETYLFLDRVVELSPDGESPGAQWPQPTEAPADPWGGEDGIQMIDYGMDPDVTDSTATSGQISAAFTQIPSVSLVTDLANLFDPNDGIYVNADQDGDAWERFGSFELIYPDGSAGCQANAGIRIRGGYSRMPTNPKHAFRLFFRTEHGTPKLRFPLFGSEGEASFDKLDLRTEQNYSWAFEGDQFGVNTAVRDVFSRDLQRALGRPYTRSRPYHLFLDGVYWGLFQSQERAEQHFADSYLEGDDVDFDVIKVERNDDDPIIFATAGTTDTWQMVWDLCQVGFASDADYFHLEGKGPDGARDPSLPVLVDIDNLIDYLLIVFHTGNFDAPVTKFFENAKPNNFIAIKNRIDPEHGFVFFAHDSEHTLLPDPIRAGDGLAEDRVNIGYPGSATDEDHRINDQWQMSVTEFERFHPQWLHHRLVDNALYRERFAARAQAVLAPGGVMAPDRLAAMFQARADEIDLAIIAESARWGDAKRPDSPRTKDGDWLPAIEDAQGFIGARPPIFIPQLQLLGLHP